MTETRIGNKSKPASSRKREPEFCRFCSKVIERIKVGTDRFSIEIPGRCECEEAQAQHAEQKRKRLVEEEAAEARERQLRIDRLHARSLIPSRWKTRTFEHLQVSETNRVAYENAKEYADAFKRGDGSGLLFTGSVGTGKTHLSAAIALELLEREFSVVFGTVTTLLAEIRRTYEDEKSSDYDVFNRMAKCDLLIIDDLGKEKVTEWVDQTIYEIINTRYENNKALIITTNMSLTTLRSKYTNTGEAVVSRILEMCHGIKMDGPDWRKKALA